MAHKSIHAKQKAKKRARRDKLNRVTDELVPKLLRARQERIDGGAELCECDFDFRNYQDVVEQERDERPPVVCPQCSKPKMRVNKLLISASHNKLEFGVSW